MGSQEAIRQSPAWFSARDTVAFWWQWLRKASLVKVAGRFLRAYRLKSMILNTKDNKIIPVCKVAHRFAKEMGGSIEPQHIKGVMAGCYPVKYQPRWCSGTSSRLVESSVKRTILPTYDFRKGRKLFSSLVRITLPVCKVIKRKDTKNIVSWPKQTRCKGKWGKMDEVNLNKIRMVRY